jgi:subtilisin family serine protease
MQPLPAPCSSTSLFKFVAIIMKKFYFVATASLVLFAGRLEAQRGKASAPDNWFNLDYKTDKVPGVSTEKAYNELLQGKTPSTVVVAVIDGGTEPDHEDLKDVIWVNEKEIPGNGIDDDNNGYIDDVHGWNFIGGKDGRNVGPDNLEVTRFYGAYRAMFEGKEDGDIPAQQQALYQQWRKAFLEMSKSREQYKPLEEGMGEINKFFADVEAQAGGNTVTSEHVKAVEVKGMANFLQNALAKALEGGKSYDTLKAAMMGRFDEIMKPLKFHYNPDLNTREIVGDNYEDGNERNYGNNDVEGPDGGHGTHVAGIIGAVRNNGTGMNGVSNAVRLMVVRVVPDGDERDKDVANGIRYAVDNGAKVINMSFGKGWSYNKKLVDDAIRYAESKDVLLVHAAGNDAECNDTVPNYPNTKLTDGGRPNNWIEVGASSWNDKNVVASFSNFGKEQVDVFAPGVDIYSTVPDSKYDSYDGTSMASPVTAGVAALVRSYYPGLTAPQVKRCIMEGSSPWKAKVLNPTTKKKTKLKELCVSGGIVNAYNALQIAAGMGK